MIGVVIPTIPGRETLLSQAMVGYQSSLVRLYVERNSPSCGEGWQRGGDRAFGEGMEAVLLAADDTCPVHVCQLCKRPCITVGVHPNIVTRCPVHGSRGKPVDWWRSPFSMLSNTQFPCPSIWTRYPSVFQTSGGHWGLNGPAPANFRATNNPFPFLNHELWEAVQPIPPFNHYCDLWVTEKAVDAGYPAMVCAGFELIHSVISPDAEGENAAYERWRVDHAN